MADGIDALFRTFKADQRTGRLIKFGVGLGLLVFGFWTVGFLGIPMERLLGMFGPLGAMLANRVFPPDLVFATEWKILLSVVETIEMSLLGAFYGTVVTIPLAWWGGLEHHAEPHRPLSPGPGRHRLLPVPADPDAGSSAGRHLRVRPLRRRPSR